MSSILMHRPVLAWALYDWANSAFATTVMAGFFPVFYSAISGDLSIQDAQFWFNVALFGASLLVAIAAPILGAIADRGGSRKRFLALFAMIGILMTAGLVWVHAGQWPLGLALFALGTVGFSGANVFYDSMLPDVSSARDFDLVSAFGYALGYVGGGLLFAVNVLMVKNPEWFGLSDPGEAVRVSFLSVAVWWALFTVPLLRFVKETPTQDPAPPARAIREGWRQLRRTLSEIRKLRAILLFLVAYWIYIDGVNTVIKTAVFFGDRVLGLDQSALIAALLVTQFVAFPAALLFGWLGQRIGARPAILIGLAVYFLAIVYAWRFLRTAEDFLILAIAIGLVQGGVQSLSRSLYARLIPVDKSAEFFGFFNMVGKFATILGPLLIALTPLVVPGAGPRDSILSLSLLFLIGGFLLWRVKPEVVPGGSNGRA
ncbi:MFS transporter [Thiocystis violascens]|nr:MFS transporter [Thiocystis violascens]